MRAILRFGWVRSIGTMLTLVGAAVVSVVVVMPTVAFGSAKGGGCKIRIKMFSNDNSLNGDEASAVGIYGSNLDRVTNVQFRGITGTKETWVTASSWEYANGFIAATPSPRSIGVTGRIRIIDATPNPDCVAYSQEPYTPVRAS